MSSIKDYRLRGLIHDAGHYEADTDRSIVITSAKGNKYKCVVPKEIFSNYQVGDIIDCQVEKTDANTYRLLSRPLISFQVDRSAVEDYFVRACQGKGLLFGKQSASDLYARLQTYAASIAAPEPEILPEVASAVASETLLPGVPLTTRIRPSEAVIGVDGVIPLLERWSEDFYTSKNRDSLEAMASHLTDAKKKDKQSESILLWWYKNRSLRALYCLGFTNKQIQSCRPLDNAQIYEAAITNPYKLAALSLEACADIMKMLKRVPTATQLNCGAILRKVTDYADNSSWTLVAFKTLSWHFPKLPQYLAILQEEYGIVLDGKNVYLEKNYAIECFIAELTHTLITATARSAYSDADRDKFTSSYKFGLNTLVEEQKTAIYGALNDHICIITGGAGTGKSRICREIVDNFEKRGLSIAATSFTGKAVMRLNQCLKERSAKTMDYMIRTAGSWTRCSEPSPDCQFQVERRDDGLFYRKTIPPFDVLIIDEASMITSELMYRFKRAFPHYFKIIFIGDCNQLPPIGCGNLLKQLIASERVPIYTLLENHRLRKYDMEGEEEKDDGLAPSQREFERIILTNCENLIDKDRDLSFPMQFEEGHSFYPLNGKTAGKGFGQQGGGMATLEILVSQLIGAFDSKDITIISPYNQCVSDINVLCQQLYLPTAKEIVDKNGKAWKQGDRVMMLKNNYDINVMNGEEGIVTGFNDKGIMVKFGSQEEVHTFAYPERMAKWKRVEAADDENFIMGGSLSAEMLSHSFAISVHKSQGSEYPYVIFYVPERRSLKGNLSSFLNINLLYTALTRTQKAVWIIAEQSVLNDMTITKMRPRCDGLAGRILRLKNEDLERCLESRVRIRYKQCGNAGEADYDEEDMPCHDDDNWD
jgi:ATP-dependent exoDNAse (exonuclease V) alpha subunit